MPKNMSLQMRIITAFLFVGALVLIVALIGWSGNSRLSYHINTITSNSLPSIDSLWKVNEAQARVLAGERSLAISALTADQRQKELTNIQTGLKDINDGFSLYDKLPRDPEEDKIYKKVQSEWDKWKATTQEYLQLHDQVLRSGVVNPRRVQIELLQQGKANTPEFAAAAATSDALTKLNDYAFTKLAPAFETSTNALLELLQYNRNLSATATKAAEQDVSRSTFWILVGLIIGPLTAILFGIYFSLIVK